MYPIPDGYPAWLTYEDLVRDSRELARKLMGMKFRGVVAIARSGIVPAAVVAMQTHAPLFIYSPQTGKVLAVGGGARMKDQSFTGELVLIDDTTASFQTLEKAFADTGIRKAAVVYAAPGTEHRLLAYGRLLPFPHILEWNFWNSVYMEHVATDLDGLLCPDPTEYDVQDRRRYINWMRMVEPIDGPRRQPVKAIISARPEWARKITEQWLSKHGFKYKALYLIPEETRDPAAHALFKAQVINDIKPFMYVESSPVIAEQIRPHLVVSCAVIVGLGGQGYAVDARWRTQTFSCILP